MKDSFSLCSRKTNRLLAVTLRFKHSFRKLLISWVDKVYPERKRRLSQAKSCALVHLIDSGTCWWKQFIFLFCFGFVGWAGAGQRSTMEVSSKALLIFSHNEWWLSALPLWASQQPSEVTFTEASSFSTAQKTFKCSQMPPHSSTQIPLSFSPFPEGQRSWSWLSRCLIWEQSGNLANNCSKTKDGPWTIGTWTILKERWENLRTHGRNTFQNINKKRTQQSNMASERYSHRRVHLDCISSSKTAPLF